MEDDAEAPKPKAPRKAAARPAKARKKAAPEAAVADAVAGQLRKKDLIAKVQVALGARQGSVKDVVEAVLDTLGRSLRAGDSLSLAPLGRIRVVRTAERGEGKATSMTVRITTGGKAKAGKEALAAPVEQG